MMDNIEDYWRDYINKSIGKSDRGAELGKGSEFPSPFLKGENSKELDWYEHVDAMLIQIVVEDDGLYEYWIW